MHVSTWPSNIHFICDQIGFTKLSLFLTNNRAEVLRSFITKTVREESQVTPQGRHR